ncbi:hypothetical protein O4J56_24035 [Nocardiopsis sp. RSe5-2]|uniref:Lipoprotein n=1 Tax=Nocardiopsis endophytica TaxID=3018445 RepID=A0ABT4U9W2_9ACTN|nr:hypothetical protein [Nocardiopsis endophytica]MDA2813736.1 hypothetical protein [Nocardiopsis endophytica]
MRPAVKAAAPALVVALALAGCSANSRDKAPEDGGGGGAAASPSQVSTDEVIAEGTFPYNEHKGEVKIEVNGLTVRGDLMQLDYTLTAGTPSSDADRRPNLTTIGASTSGSQIWLVDMENLLRYKVVEDEAGGYLQPSVTTDITYDEPTVLTAFFAAPREEATAFDIYFYGFDPIMNVPLQEEG